MSGPYENRRRALRIALAEAPPGAPFPSIPFQAVLDFEHRTGPLVEALAAAVREMQKFGEHEGPCRFLGVPGTGVCVDHEVAFKARRIALEAALAALDEEASRV